MSEKRYSETALLVATRGTRIACGSCSTCVSGHLETELGAAAPGSKAAMPIGTECSPCWYGTPMGLFYEFIGTATPRFYQGGTE
ncbi:hypothetical protein PPGU19_058650 [Paraburkholderia sp. PGU19]|nr:hypothetical protein PPGU19_058650 [Paraburkholderia sp. PGU19]